MLATKHAPCGTRLRLKEQDSVYPQHNTKGQSIEPDGLKLVVPSFWTAQAAVGPKILSRCAHTLLTNLTWCRP